jgi:tetrapyrrole methylase family protein/MazG family protein
LEIVEDLALYQIDRSPHIGLLTALYLPPINEAASFEAFQEVIAHLRAPDGCPWDREQDYATLRGYLLEECYEVVQALDDRDEDALGEELGDLLFQIVFLARIAKERGRFTIDDVVRGIAEKMVRRHPHVFGGESAADADEVLRNWEAIKRREKESNGSDPDGSVLSGIPAALPALQKAERLGTKAARVGFDWQTDEDVLDKIEEELGEFRQALRSGDRAAIHEELGDVLFALAMLARRREIDAEKALEDTNRKFVRRFRAVEREVASRDLAIDRAGLDLLDRLWNEVKAAERAADPDQDA